MKNGLFLWLASVLSMDIRHLKAFIAVFEARNITVAAQRLCVAQPTLSVTIRQLEEELGAELFLRQARGVEVSEQARELYPQACRMVAEAEALRLRFRQGQERVPLALGIEADIAPAQVEACVRLASQAVAGLQLTLLEGCDGDARLADESQRCEDELFLPLWEEAFVRVMATGSQPDGRWITCPQHPSHQRLMGLYDGGGAGRPGRFVATGPGHGRRRAGRGLVAAVAGRALPGRLLAAGQRPDAAPSGRIVHVP